MCENSNRNATASWSGFSHQGQVGLLIALRELQRDGVNKDKTFVQYEKHEDVAIYEVNENGDKNYLSVHQVKAYYSDNAQYKSTYDKVLNEDFESGNQLFLHTTKEISDWNTSATLNNNEVLRFEYSKGVFHCGTTEIENLIKAELATLLDNIPSFSDNALYRLTYELDLKIRTEHKKASKPLFDIHFSLTQIEDLIRNTSNFEAKEIYDCRKLFYDSFREILKTEDITQEKIDEINNGIIKEINDLDDENFLLFLQRLNLNETAEMLKSTQVAFNQVGLRQVFFRILIDIINTPPVLIDKTVKYKKETEPANFVLTAIIEEERDKLTVIENILTNLTSQDLLWENYNSPHC